MSNKFYGINIKPFTFDGVWEDIKRQNIKMFNIEIKRTLMDIEKRNMKPVQIKMTSDLFRYYQDLHSKDGNNFLFGLKVTVIAEGMETVIVEISDISEIDNIRRKFYEY